MALIQDSKVLFEQDTQIKAIFSNGQMVWPTVFRIPYSIVYTTTDNAKINPYSTSGLTIKSHTFTDNIGTIVLDPSTTEIPYHFFYNMSTLATVEYGKGITFSASGYIHESCPNLNSVILPNDLTYIPQRMFRICPLLTSLDVPATVTGFGYYFLWQSGMVEGYYTPTVKINNPVPVDFSNTSTWERIFITDNPSTYFDGMKNTPQVNVPANVYNDYSNDTYWGQLPYLNTV